MKQRDILQSGEADAWFRRNRDALARRSYDGTDRVVAALDRVLTAGATPAPATVLEVGVGEGGRLAWLADRYTIRPQGLDPSGEALALARARGIEAAQGTAERLPFDDGSVDVLIYGFCLYLCDRDDLFAIAAEAHRVTRPNAWIVVTDFFAEEPVAVPNHHVAGLWTYKMDNRRLFDWHPDYACVWHEVYDHAGRGHTDEPGDRVATSVLRKRAPRDG